MMSKPKAAKLGLDQFGFINICLQFHGVKVFTEKKEDKVQSLNGKIKNLQRLMLLSNCKKLFTFLKKSLDYLPNMEAQCSPKPPRVVQTYESTQKANMHD